VSLALVLVFLIGAAFYVWTAATSVPLSLTGGQLDYYNQLATAFLHLHLSIGAAPAGLLHLANPQDPAQNAPYGGLYPDLALYHGRFYLQWGPPPVVVLLVPLHLLGLAPTQSFTVALFAIAGLGFALATLRVLLRRFDALPLWMGVLAAAVLVCSTSIMFLLRDPLIYEEAVAGGYCFAMAGVFIAVRAIVRGRASLALVALMSLCFGLACGSRPPLLAAAVLIIPVFRALRGTHSTQGLLAALLAPVGACLALLLAYNYARFGNPLENGVHYQLANVDSRTARVGSAAYLLPNLWYYGISPPRPTILFPFLTLTPPPTTYPLGIPSGARQPWQAEPTGGLLTMTPVVVFALALPWLCRRRPQMVEPLGTPMLMTAGAGLVVLLFLSYEIWLVTERYTVDFTALLLFAALTAWFALSLCLPGRKRRGVRICGALLAIWGCLAGVAISFTGDFDFLRREHPGTFKAFEDATSPISTAGAILAGHPILAAVEGPNVVRLSPIHLTSAGAGVESFWLPSGAHAQLTIVSPDRRKAAIVATMAPGAALRSGTPLALRVTDASRRSHEYQLGGLRQFPQGPRTFRLPVELNRGINRVLLTPFATALNPPNPAIPSSEQLLIVPALHIAAHA
jgi:hypothetical protein